MNIKENFFHWSRGLHAMYYVNLEKLKHAILRMRKGKNCVERESNPHRLDGNQSFYR
jgi:hypothetical protein